MSTEHREAVALGLVDAKGNGGANRGLRHFGRTFATDWDNYCRWGQAIWSGREDDVLDELRERQEKLGVAKPDDPDHSPRRLLGDALRHLTNQRSRMRYDLYRREGLPITSSHIESSIKQINRRVKGAEKFWSTDGAEALLQLSADYLSRIIHESRSTGFQPVPGGDRQDACPTRVASPRPPGGDQTNRRLVTPPNGW